MIDIIEECMKMTSFGGQAKSLAIQAISKAREFDFSEAEVMLAEAKMYLNKSHEAHTNLLSADADDEEQDMQITFFTIHAADHLSSADTVMIMAKEFIQLYKEKRREHNV